jgi:hypothetical protein
LVCRGVAIGYCNSKVYTSKPCSMTQRSHRYIAARSEGCAIFATASETPPANLSNNSPQRAFCHGVMVRDDKLPVWGEALSQYSDSRKTFKLLKIRPRARHRLPYGGMPRDEYVKTKGIGRFRAWQSFRVAASGRRDDQGLLEFRASVTWTLLPSTA